MSAPAISRADWLDMRRNYLGASEAAAAIGENPWKRPFELYHEKRGTILPDDLGDNERVQFGHLFEDAIVAEHGRRSGRLILTDDRDEIEERLTAGGACKLLGWVDDRQPFVQSTIYPWMAATLDGVAIDEQLGLVLVEAKNTGEFMRDEWRNGSAPDWYRVQCYHALTVVQAAAAGALCAVVGGNKYRCVDILRAEVPSEALVELERKFWLGVLSGTEPEIDGSDSTRRALEKLHPDDDGSMIVLSSAALELHNEYIKLEAAIEPLESRREEIKTVLRGMVGAATFGELPNGAGCYSLKTTERKGYVAKPSKYRTLRFVAPKPSTRS